MGGFGSIGNIGPFGPFKIADPIVIEPAYIHRIKVQSFNANKIPISGLKTRIREGNNLVDEQHTDVQGRTDTQVTIKNIPVAVFKVQVFDEDTLLYEQDHRSTGKSNSEVVTEVPVEINRFFIVKGKVTDPENKPHESLRVVAYDRVPGLSNPLQETMTDANGHYFMSFWTHELEQNYGRVIPNLLIKVFNPSGDEIAASQILTHPSGEETIDFEIEPSVYGGKSEFDTFYERVAPELDNLLADGVDAGDYLIISEMIKADVSQVNHLLDAVTLGKRTGINPEWLYGLFRRGIPSTPSNLSKVTLEELKEGISEAIDLNLISENVLNELEDLFRKIKRIKVDADLQADEDAETESSLGRVLAWAGLRVDQQTSLYLDYITKTVTDEEFWHEVVQSGRLSRKTVDTIQLNIKLLKACDQEVGVFEILVEKYQPKTIYDLSELTYEGWLDLVQDAAQRNRIPHITVDEFTGLVNRITGLVEELIPTALLVKLFEQENALLFDPAWNYLREHIESFDFKDQNINEYIDQHIETIQGIEHIDHLRLSLNRIQRVFLLAPVSYRSKITLALLKLNLDAASKILRIGEVAFVKYYKEGLGLDHLEENGKAAHASKVFMRAKKQAKLLQQLHGTYGASFNTLPVYAIPQNPKRYKEKVDIPGLNTIFEQQEISSCTHCASVLSPAAYFIDLLSFLDEAEINRNGDQKSIYNETALDLLFVRRPDLKHLVLNCENTNTPLSYLDLVNEVLENAIVKELEDELLISNPVLQYRLRGKVVSVATDKPVPLKGVFVQLFLNNASHDQMLTESTTDRFGKFELIITPQNSDLLETSVKVIYQHTSLKVDHPVINWSEKKQLQDILLQVNPNTAEAKDHKKELAYLESNDLWVIGGIIQDENGNAMKDCMVMAWDYDYQVDDLLGVHEVNMDGSFEIKYHSSAFADNTRDRKVDPYLVILHKSQVIYFKFLGMNLRKHMDLGVIRVNEKIRNIKRLSVQMMGSQKLSGTVKDPSGNPIMGLRVELIENGVNEDQPVMLGVATTNTNGQYEVLFETQDWNGSAELREGNFLVSFGPIRYNRIEEQIVCSNFGQQTLNQTIDSNEIQGDLNGFISGNLKFQYASQKPDGHLVEAWRQDGPGGVWMGNAMTSASGKFTIPTMWRGNTGSDKLFFKVYKDDNFIYQTQVNTYSLLAEGDKKGINETITLPYFGKGAEVDTITLKGELLDKKTGRPVKARIAFWEKDKGFIGMQLAIFTNRSGYFEENIQLPIEWLQSGKTKKWNYKVLLPDRILFEKHVTFNWSVKDKVKYLEILVDREQPGFSLSRDLYIISGQLTHEETGSPLRGMTVEAWDHDDTGGDDLLGIAKTDLNGRYEISFESQYFRDHVDDDDPDIYFKVFQNGELIKQLDVQENVKDRVLIQNIQARPNVELVISGTRGPLLKEVYDTLADTTFPLMFPFILPEEECKLYLEALGIYKQELIEQFNPGTDTRLSSAMAYLDFYYKELEILKSNAVKRHYGLSRYKSVSILNDVPYLLDKTRMSFEDLKALIKTQYVNPNRKEIIFKKNETKIYLDQGEYINLHRLSTFQSKTGFAPDELDFFIEVFETVEGELKEGTIDDFIIFLANLHEISKKGEGAFLDLLTWFTDLVALRGYDAVNYFVKTIISCSITDGHSGSLFALDSTSEKLVNSTLQPLNPNGQLNESVALSLINAIRSTPQELSEMLRHFSVKKLTVANISQLYRVVSFTRFNELEIRDYFRLVQIIGYHPVLVDGKKTRPADALKFIDELSFIRSSGFSLEEVFQISTGAHDKIWTQELERLHLNIVEAIGKLSVENTLPEEVPMGYGNVVSLQLMDWLDMPEDILTILLDSAPSFDPDSSVKLYLGALPWNVNKIHEDFLSVFNWLNQWSVIVRKLNMRPSELLFIFDFAEINGWFKPHLDIKDQGLGYFGWKEMVDAQLVNQAFYQKDIPDFFDILRENHIWQADNQNASAAKRKEGLSTFYERVNKLTSWPIENFYFLIGNEFHQWKYPEDFLTTHWITKLHHDFRFLQKSGILTTQVAALRSVLQQDFTLEHAEILQLALKSKVPPGQWDEKLNSLKDRLREKQRDALQTFLLSRDTTLGSVEDIYARYLIDTEMSSSMLTSRIKQGISSVQLLVQRIRMGLEPGVSFNKEDMKEWIWRKNYRVWEANRKVFLYPENWIEPELRKDKSVIFEKFEEELLQGEITNENAEKAFGNYLQKLDEVANLEIGGLCYQKQEDIYHIVARTRNLPHKYFYRQWMDRQFWTAWTEIQIDIESDHLIPVFWNRKLWIFWPIFMEKADEPSESSMVYDPNPRRPVKGEKPRMKLEIKMAMTAMEKGGWMPKKISETSFQSPLPDRFNAGESNFEFIQFRAFPRENDLELKVYNNQEASRYKEIGRFVLNNATFTMSGSKNSGSAFSVRFEGGAPEFSKIKMRKSTLQVEGHNLIKTSPTFYLTNSLEEGASIEPWFYEDRQNTFLVSKKQSQALPNLAWNGPQSIEDIYVFKNFSHPLSGLLRKLNSRFGAVGLFDPPEDSTIGKELIDYQRPQNGIGVFFEDKFRPGTLVGKPYPKTDLSFDLTDPYSGYNWELFFHAPLSIASRLSQNQRFEEAQQWFHYIFNPMETKGEAPRRFWQIKPFYQFQDYSDIRDIVKALDSDREHYTRQVDYWEENPFDPHVIARMRNVAYMKTVVMKYLDNLIAWGDQLFRRDTIETINEATQIYILASQVLGKRPIFLEGDRVENLTVADMFENLDVFSNALVEMENQLPPLDYADLKDIELDPSSEENSNTFNSILYFCIPENDHLLSYWETVADRMFKIRSGMNIEGVKRQLKLFEAPIDPGMLVKAAAKGIDIGTALSELNVRSSHYRFSYLLPKAIELCNEVKSLGSALLSALEKKDAEELSLLRSKHELVLLGEIREIKKKAIEEAEASYISLEKSLESAQKRFGEYGRRLREGANTLEEVQVGMMIGSTYLKAGAAGLHFLASPLALLPAFTMGIAGAFGSPVVEAKMNMSKMSDSAREAASAIQSLSGVIDSTSNILGTYASWERRAEDWQLQKDLAAIEKEQIQYQIDAATIRHTMAVKELKNHEKQMDQFLEVKTFMESKFSNTQLYQWMVGQISTVYFQSYQLAYDLAKKAEKAYAYELGTDAPDIIQFGYWDSLKKGLLSGDKLLLDLRRLESAYLEQNKRLYEMTKHISMALFNPNALLDLKENGSCEFELPETIFDLDHPGHLKRRIKSVSMTIPCITGPYTNVNCKLTLLSSRVRKNNSTVGGYEYQDINDDRFNHDLTGIQSISTSSAQNDSGVFELNFRDERYLPFEGAGVISRWRLEMPKNWRQFDYNSISDVIMHINYTADEGGDVFKEKVEDYILDGLNKLANYFAASGDGLQLWLDLKNYFSDAYHQLLTVGEGEISTEAQFEISQDYLPFFLKDKEAKLKGITILIKTKTKNMFDDIKVTIGVSGKPWPGEKEFVDYENDWIQAYFGTTQFLVNKWRIKLVGPGVKKLNEDMIESVIIVGDYFIKS